MTTSEILNAMPLDGNVRIATAEQLEAYVKAVSAGAISRLSPKASPMKLLGTELIAEDIMTKFMVSGNAVFCGHRFKRNQEK